MNRITNEQKARVLELRGEYKTYENIAMETGLSLSSIMEICQAANMGLEICEERRNRRNDEIEQHIIAGESITDICKEVSCSHETVKKVARERNLELKRIPKDIENRKQFLELTDNGMSVRDAAEITGYTVWQGYGFIRQRRLKSGK